VRISPVSHPIVADGLRYLSNIEMPGGTVRYVPMHPPKDGGERTSSAANWKIDMEALERTINPKTRMIVSI
jgi:kynurenine aminotransferase